VRKISKKKAKVLVYRRKLKKQLIKERGDRCELRCSPDCYGEAHGLHEPEKQCGRPYTVGDTREVLLSCNPCNGWVENNPNKAKSMGLAVSKYGRGVKND